MGYHQIAFLAGVLLDWLLGDPTCLPHPIRWIGKLIEGLTQKLLQPYLDSGRDSKREKQKGLLLVMLVLTVTIALTATVSIGAYKVHPYFGIVVEAILTCYILAAKSLFVESKRVRNALVNEGIESARRAVARIVGRDTQCLDQEGVIKAAVETVAENTSDGVIAPLLYTYLGGPILGMAYKAINTMDSMVGYHNETYENFGFYAARLDDRVNYIPARISAVFMIAAAYLMGKRYSGKGAVHIFRRDRYRHKSPNSAQTESVCAGAMGIQLAGDASYFGKKIKKPYIGDPIRAIEIEDIISANRLMFGTELLVILACLMITVLV